MSEMLEVQVYWIIFTVNKLKSCTIKYYLPAFDLTPQAHLLQSPPQLIPPETIMCN